MFKVSNTYVLGVVASGLFSKGIQLASENEYFKLNDTWSHVACAFYHWAYGWVVIESIYPGGVRMLYLGTWVSENWNKNKVEAFEYKINTNELFQHLGKGYSLMDVARLARTRFTMIKAKGFDDINRKYCAELIADCDNNNISNALQIKPWQVIPADFQIWGKLNDKEIIDVRDVLSRDVPLVA